jgi:hypothetical protein
VREILSPFYASNLLRIKQGAATTTGILIFCAFLF